MKILIVGLVKNPQLERLREEAEKRGHSVDGCYVAELTLFSTPNSFEPTLRGKSMEEYDLIYLWALGERRWEWYTACLYLNEKFGTKIINHKVIDPSYHYYLTPAIDYLTQTKEGINFPESALVFSEKSLDAVLPKFSFPLIVKRSNGRQGKGVFKANNRDEIVAAMKEIEDISPSFVIREFIPNDGDVRVFTVGYKAIGAMKRTPKEGDFRSNISQGGDGAPFDLEKYPEVKEIAEKTAKAMRTEIAGVDVMINKDTGVPYILEVNPGPQFMGLEKYTETNAALEIVKYCEELTSK